MSAQFPGGASDHPELPRDGSRRRSDSPVHRNARILVVEDSPSARKLMQAVLVRLGVELPELRIAPTVAEALVVFTEWQPQIAIVDLELRPPPDRPAPSPPPPPPIGMPTGGSELVRHLLQRDPDLQVIVCSATDPARSPLAPLVREGRIQALVKPVLAARVRESLGRAAEARLGPNPRRRPGG